VEVVTEDDLTKDELLSRFLLMEERITDYRTKRLD
jgi:hypothetical protein